MVYYFYLFPVSFILLLSGCIMPESNHIEPDFYLLSHHRQEQDISPSNDDFSFFLREIELPRYLKDARMIMRPTLHTVEFRETKRWGEPLEDGIARVLAQNLKSELGASDYSIFPNRRKNSLRWDISVSLSAFERKLNNQFEIRSKWTIKDRNNKEIFGSFASELDLPRNGDELAELQVCNLALQELAVAIKRTFSAN